MNCRVCGNKMKVYDVIEESVYDIVNFYNEPSESKKYDIDIFICEKCNHFQTKYIIDESYYKKYNIVYNPENNEGNRYPKKLLNYYNKSFDKIKILISNYENVLDIGCASGEILKLLEKKFVNCIGVEPSTNLCNLAKSKGCTVINSCFNSKLKLDNKFNCVTCIMVLEHIDELNDFIRAIYNILEDNGILLINIPNGQKIINTGSYFDIFYEHINYFTPSSLVKLLSLNGFEIVSLDEEFGAGFHLTGYFRKVKKAYLFSEKKFLDKENIKLLTCDFYKIGIWGLGIRSRNIINLIEIDKIQYLFDMNEALEGKYIVNNNNSIQKPKKELINECDMIIITSLEYYEEIYQQLVDWNYEGKIAFIKNGEIIINGE